MYEAYREGNIGELEELPIQYADYAVWQRERMKGEALEQHMRYWKEQLKGLGVEGLPTDRPRPAVASHRGSVETVRLTKELSNELKRMS